tara:strand:- start:2118 stop:2453 length:336 start_codon:yes stop_codon:yes gene_type:complete
MNADEFAQKIRKAKKVNNYYSGLCPGHHDRKPSLTWGDATNRNGIWVKCFAHCDLKQICSALNMEAKEIYEGIPVSRPIWESSGNKGKSRNQRGRKENMVDKTIRKKWNTL